MYLPRSSFESADDIILRRTDDGAVKCALRDFRLEDETSAWKVMLSVYCPQLHPNAKVRIQPNSSSISFKKVGIEKKEQVPSYRHSNIPGLNFILSYGLLEDGGSVGLECVMN